MSLERWVLGICSALVVAGAVGIVNVSISVAEIRNELNSTKPADVLKAVHKLDVKMEKVLSLDTLPGSKKGIEANSSSIKELEKMAIQMDFRMKQIEKAQNSG